MGGATVQVKKSKAVPFDPMSFVVIGSMFAFFLIGTGTIMEVFAFTIEASHSSLAYRYGIPTKYMGVAFIVAGIALLCENLALWITYKRAYTQYMGRPRLYSCSSVDAAPRSRGGPVAV